MTAISCRKCHVLLVALAALAISGCAASQESGQRRVIRRVDAYSANAGTVSATDNKQPVRESDNTKVVRPASHSEGMVRSAPGPLMFQDEEDVEGGHRADSSGETSGGSDSAPEELVEPPMLTLPAPVTETEQPVDYFVSIALAGHPKIRAARDRVAAAANVIPQARALPDPMFGNTFWPIHDQALQTAGGRVGHQFQLSQGVPWPEKLRTKAAIASREVQMAQAEVQRIEREITEMVRLAYYEV